MYVKQRAALVVVKRAVNPSTLNKSYTLSSPRPLLLVVHHPLLLHYFRWWLPPIPFGRDGFWARIAVLELESIIGCFQFSCEDLFWFGFWVLGFFRRIFCYWEWYGSSQFGRGSSSCSQPQSRWKEGCWAEFESGAWSLLYWPLGWLSINWDWILEILIFFFFVGFGVCLFLEIGLSLEGVNLSEV